MALSKKELRREVRGELCEALRFCGRAANLLSQAKKDCHWKEGTTKYMLLEVVKTAEALEQIVASTTKYIHHLLSE